MKIKANHGGRTIPLSKTQIDRLGDRLRKGDISETDLQMLDHYRREFAEAYEQVVGLIREELVLEPTGRREKSTPSISEKLHRESIRLSQIQDIAGCRLVVQDIASQEQVVEHLARAFESVVIVDRRSNPSHGYRAVHVIVKSQGKSIEIQVRTQLQHLWAEYSEKLSDRLGPTVKYGGGTKTTRNALSLISDLIADTEALETELSSPPSVDSPSENDIRLRQIKQRISTMIGDSISTVLGGKE